MVPIHAEMNNMSVAPPPSVSATPPLPTPRQAKPTQRTGACACPPRSAAPPRGGSRGSGRSPPGGSPPARPCFGGREKEGRGGEGRGGGCVRSDEGWRHKARAAWSPPSTAGGRSVDPTQHRDPVPTCAPVPPPTTPTRGPPRARGTPLCHLYPTPETPHGRRNAPVLVVAQGRRRVQLLHLHGRGGCGGRHPCARPW